MDAAIRVCSSAEHFLRSRWELKKRIGQASIGGSSVDAQYFILQYSGLMLNKTTVQCLFA